MTFIVKGGITCSNEGYRATALSLRREHTSAIKVVVSSSSSAGCGTSKHTSFAGKEGQPEYVRAKLCPLSALVVPYMNTSSLYASSGSNGHSGAGFKPAFEFAMFLKQKYKLDINYDMA